MGNKYSGLRDPHLNVFYTYGDKSHLENNITKAFVNVLQSLNNKEFREIVKTIFGFELPKGNYLSTFYLQRKPKEDFVKCYPNRIMFAFSPSGKSWGFEGLDTKNEKEIRKTLEEEAKKRTENEEEQREYIKYTLNDILKVRENKGSIPDGWLFIDVDNKPLVVIAMENKLYDLDPYQLNNHIEKSLFILENKPKPIYRKYDDIVVAFKNVNSYLSDQFVEYLTILNYTKVEDFSTACLADSEIRQKLVMNFGKELLDIVHEGKKDNRSHEMVRCHVNYDYLHEINVLFRKEAIELWLSFGPTQNSAKQMLNRIDKIVIDDQRFSSYRGFHLLYSRGRIIKDSYVDEWTLDEFIDYWKKNINLVKTSSPKETISLYQKMYDDGKINIGQLNKIKGRLMDKKNPILIVPEITFIFSWSYEEAAELGLARFGQALREKLNIALSEMKLN